MSFLIGLRFLTYFELSKLPPRKREPWFVLWSFSLLTLCIVFTYYRALHGNSCHNWSGTPNWSLVILNILGKLPQWVCKASGLTLSFYETLANLQNMASMIVFWSYCFRSCSSELTELAPLLIPIGCTLVFFSGLNDFIATVFTVTVFTVY